MKVWTGIESISAPVGPLSVAVGTFDGVHVGHQTLIAAAVRDARSHERASAVFTFDRRPMDVIAPERAQGYLTTPAQRERAIAALGVDHLVVARFDTRLRETAPDGFVRDTLAGRLGARTVMVGEGFRFGRDQSGGVRVLRERGRDAGIDVVVLRPVMVGGQKASSSRARELVLAGNVAEAARVLGRPFALVGTVIEGDRIGRTLGYPTANLRVDFPQVIPAYGIYAVRVAHSGGTWPGAASIGIRPTIGGRERRIEAYLMDFDGDLYGQVLEVSFIERLRDELRFDSLEALVTQMGRDVAEARALVAASDPPAQPPG